MAPQDSVLCGAAAAECGEGGEVIVAEKKSLVSPPSPTPTDSTTSSERSPSAKRSTPTHFFSEAAEALNVRVREQNTFLHFLEPEQTNSQLAGSQRRSKSVPPQDSVRRVQEEMGLSVPQDSAEESLKDEEYEVDEPEVPIDPATGLATSVGSQGHGDGSCRPCHWVRRARGCKDGTLCRFCHFSCHYGRAGTSPGNNSKTSAGGGTPTIRGAESPQISEKAQTPTPTPVAAYMDRQQGFFTPFQSPTNPPKSPQGAHQGSHRAAQQGSQQTSRNGQGKGQGFGRGGNAGAQTRNNCVAGVSFPLPAWQVTGNPRADAFSGTLGWGVINS